MFNEIVTNLLELIETRLLKTREYVVNLLNELPNFINEVISINPSREPLNLVVVDSGFSDIHYLGFRFFIINVAILLIKDGKSRLSTYFQVNTSGLDEIEKQALDLELRLGIDIMRKSHVDLLLLDGPLSTRNKGIIGGESILAHVKDVEINRYSQSITDKEFRQFMLRFLDFIGEPMIIYLLMETYRKSRNDYLSVLMSKPYIVSDEGLTITGFYVQYMSRTLPIYVEYVGHYDPSRLIARIAPMAIAPRLGYPAPLYIVDRVSRVNDNLKSMVRLILEKLGGDALRELRSIYFSKDVNDYVKGL